MFIVCLMTLIDIKTIKIILTRIQKSISQIKLQKEFETLIERINHCIRSKRIYVE